MNVIYSYLEDFFSLFFPEICPACNETLVKNELVICTNCIYHLPYTNFHLESDNRVARQLWGRVPFINATAFLYFHKGSKVQNLLHELKYNNRTDVGLRLGEMCGHALMQSKQYTEIDLIIPVPLHEKRQRIRGYNQSDFFAKGLSMSLNIPMHDDVLKRAIQTETQTKKSRYSRYENIKNVFEVSKPDFLEGKHILLVDDVMTTGATIEACSLKLLEVTGTKISVATIAFTN